MLSYSFRYVHLPKMGNTAEENEDAFTEDFEQRATEDGFRLAIADGATESSFSREWARMLVQRFPDLSFTRDDFHDTLIELQYEWLAAVQKFNLPWYAEEKMAKGAYTAFLGLTISTISQQWHTMSVGDCCLFHLREGRYLTSFPFKALEEMAANPYLICSIDSNNFGLEDFLLEETGTLEEGDTLLLATDSVTAYCLQEKEDGLDPFSGLQEMFRFPNYQETIEWWLNTMRENKRIKNDDCTILQLQF